MLLRILNCSTIFSTKRFALDFSLGTPGFCPEATECWLQRCPQGGRKLLLNYFDLPVWAVHVLYNKGKVVNILCQCLPFFPEANYCRLCSAFTEEWISDVSGLSRVAGGTDDCQAHLELWFPLVHTSQLMVHKLRNSPYYWDLLGKQFRYNHAWYIA